MDESISYLDGWNREYLSRGIPSSYREEPSSVLRWALSNWSYLSSRLPKTAIDIGSGTGRNTIELARQGIEAVGVEQSSIAMEKAVRRSRDYGPEGRLRFIEADINRGLPFDDREFDLATDIFVYFHQTDQVARDAYRREIRRVLKNDGLLLLSFAPADDGFYGSCPILEAGARSGREVPISIDPIAKVGNILVTLEQLILEMSEEFELQMTWDKRRPGVMHDRRFLRRTIASLWRPRI